LYIEGQAKRVANVIVMHQTIQSLCYSERYCGIYRS
jgi:hypothetical protein